MSDNKYPTNYENTPAVYSELFKLSKKNIEKNLKSPIKDWAEQLLNNIIKTR